MRKLRAWRHFSFFKSFFFKHNKVLKVHRILFFQVTKRLIYFYTSESTQEFLLFYNFYTYWRPSYSISTQSGSHNCLLVSPVLLLKVQLKCFLCSSMSFLSSIYLVLKVHRIPYFQVTKGSSTSIHQNQRNSSSKLVPLIYNFCAEDLPLHFNTIWTYWSLQFYSFKSSKPITSGGFNDTITH